jgi:flagellar hook-associated protein 1 FlgK
VESATHGDAGALRDQRDLLLRQLSELVQLEVREQPNGSINVYVGNEPLIQDGVYRGITSTLEVADNEPRTVARFADTGAPISLRGGKLAGLVAARDQDVMGHVRNLDQLAAALIREVNRVHAQGRGLAGVTDVTGTFDVLDPAAALSSAAAGLASPPRNGSFQITLLDKATGAATVTTITVDLDGIGADDSLNSLVARINAQVGNLTASVTTDNRLRITAAGGYEMSFGQDSANLLAALGVNTFFTGSGAQDIAVNPMLLDNNQLIAAGTSFAEGDGSNAAALAALADAALASLNGQSLTEFYNLVAIGAGVGSAAAQAGVEAADAIYSSLTAQRESISGVSLDEETISMLRLERAFQGAARFTSTVDRLIQEMLQIVG